MNREIKFKVWNKNHWITGCSLDLISGFNINRDGYVFQQFTGLLDRNGKEIYEGDIVKGFYDNKNYVIEWINGAYWIVNSKNKYYDAGGGELWISRLRYELVGNIFENPELLK